MFLFSITNDHSLLHYHLSTLDDWIISIYYTVQNALSHLIMSICLDLYKFVVLQFMTMKPKGYGNSLW